MSTITKTITAYTEEGYLTLGDLRRLVAETSDFDDSASVTAGQDEANAIDLLIVEGALPEREVLIP